MMALLGQWLGLNGSDISNKPPTTTRPSQPGIVISSSSSSSSTKKPSSPSSSSSPSPFTSGSSTPALRKTKSDELLRDFEVMRFLCSVDERLKRDNQLLTRAQLDRLQTLHMQAVTDDSLLLTDIIEHFELENDKLRYRLACAAPNSAAADAARSRRNNMLVF